MKNMNITGIAAVVLASVLVTGCGEGGKGSSQVLAKVNSDEITVHQVNFDLASQQLPKEVNSETVKKMSLERLVNRSLLVQKSIELKLDREPQVMQAIENARKMILAQAYAERITKDAPAAKPEEVKSYFDKHPELFSQRKIYQFMSVMIQSPITKEQINQALAETHNITDLVAKLKADNFTVAQTLETKSADQLPLEMLPKVAAMKVGDTVVFTGATTLIVHLIASKDAPLTEQQATPAIQNFLLSQARSKIVDQELERLRKDAKIEYVETAKAPAETKPGK